VAGFRFFKKFLLGLDKNYSDEFVDEFGWVFDAKECGGLLGRDPAVGDVFVA
jgi:hypothetical protein